MPHAPRSRTSTRTTALAGVGLAVLLSGCGAAPDSRTANSPLEKLGRLLALDFAPRAAARRSDGLRRVFDIPAAEVARVESLRAFAEAAPPNVQSRIERLPPTIQNAALAEAQRSIALTSPGPLLVERIPTPTTIAVDTARDLERVGLLLGLERRPLPEIDDRRHRTDPRDDRPEKSIWERLARRIFP